MDVSLSELRELVMDREAWRALIHRVAKSRTQLSDWSDLIWSDPSQFSYVESRLVGNELGRLTEEISKQNVEGVNWFVLIIYSKMQEETEI